MAKSKEELIYDIENELVDPTTNKITGERVKARLLDMVETMAESAGSGGSSTMEYWSIPSDVELKDLGEAVELLVYSILGKIIYDGNVFIMPIMIAVDMAPLKAFAWDGQLPVAINGSLFILNDIKSDYGFDFEDMGFARIEKEEFYSLETTTE